MNGVFFKQAEKDLVRELLTAKLNDTGFSAKFEEMASTIQPIDQLFIQLQLVDEEEVQIEAIEQLSNREKIIEQPAESNHPVYLLFEENRAFRAILEEIEQMIEHFAHHQTDLQDTEKVAQLEKTWIRLGEFHKHYHKKEKLLFPILERAGYHTPLRKNWLLDDQIRALYQGVKKQLIRLPYDDFSRFQTRYTNFSTKFRKNIIIEEQLLYPSCQLLFTKQDWTDIANESDAFGYAIIQPPQEKWGGVYENEQEQQVNVVRGGGGYLTTKEAELILNHLPLEITYVDKNDVFKYFNKIAEASEMILVRTPISIGRNVANCHPPKSLKKVMHIVRDLKSGKRQSEEMWFKMRGKYVHITYKGVFDEDGVFLGVLEYVQDIQPFFELPKEEKRALKRIDE